MIDRKRAFGGSVAAIYNGKREGSLNEELKQSSRQVGLLKAVMKYRGKSVS